MESALFIPARMVPIPVAGDVAFNALATQKGGDFSVSISMVLVRIIFLPCLSESEFFGLSFKGKQSFALASEMIYGDSSERWFRIH